MKNILSKYGVTIKNEKLLKEALTHSSYSNEHGGTCYERLEYLGDAVLEIVCSEYLYRNTNSPEGEMSKLRSLYVCENALYEYSKSINLLRFLLLLLRPRNRCPSRHYLRIHTRYRNFHSYR